MAGVSGFSAGTKTCVVKTTPKTISNRDETIKAQRYFLIVSRNEYRSTTTTSSPPGFSTTPCSTPYITASVRDATPVFSKILLRCTLTVFGLIVSSWAISRLVRPVATRRRISFSRTLNGLFSVMNLYNVSFSKSNYTRGLHQAPDNDFRSASTIIWINSSKATSASQPSVWFAKEGSATRGNFSAGR
jgi:hypothetical protein